MQTARPSQAVSVRMQTTVIHEGAYPGRLVRVACLTI